MTLVGAETGQNAQSVMANVATSASAPRSFQASTSLQLKQRSFPWKRVALNGTSYFEAPNRLAVRFANLPGYMSGLPKAYAKVLNVGAWPEEYNVTLGPPQTINGHTDVMLQLTPKISGSDDRGIALVNPSDWSVEQVSWNLSGGIQLNMSEGYAEIGSYRVPASQSLSIRTPYATADGSVQLANYALNVPINRQIFSQE
ncbi:MAG: hypothetical protein JO349_02560 [Candidatus Eremiobacteraeota bacterium]|nr:hypothetical protein [Candidatus Eremiobacteraeota bacterium]